MATESKHEVRAERGMSIIEVLVAAGLLLVISLGILALLTRSLQNNTRGWEATQTSNYARTQLDQHLGESLDAPDIQIPSGSSELETDHFWASGSTAIDNDDDEGWYDSEASAQGIILMEKTRMVQQYNVASLLGDASGFNDQGEYEFEITQGDLDSALTGDVDPRFANVKRIELTIQGRRQGGSLGAGQRLKSETYKSY